MDICIYRRPRVGKKKWYYEKICIFTKSWSFYLKHIEINAHVFVALARYTHHEKMFLYNHACNARARAPWARAAGVCPSARPALARARTTYITPLCFAIFCFTTIIREHTSSIIYIYTCLNGNNNHHNNSIIIIFIHQHFRRSPFNMHIYMYLYTCFFLIFYIYSLFAWEIFFVSTYPAI